MSCIAPDLPVFRQKEHGRLFFAIACLLLVAAMALRVQARELVLIDDAFADQRRLAPRDTARVKLPGDWRNWGDSEAAVQLPSRFGPARPALEIRKNLSKSDDWGGVLGKFPAPVVLARPGDALVVEIELRGVEYQQHVANRLGVVLLNGAASNDYRFGYGQTLDMDTRVPAEPMKRSPAGFEIFPSFSTSPGNRAGILPPAKGASPDYFRLSGVSGTSGNIDHLIRLRFTLSRQGNGDLQLQAEHADVDATQSFHVRQLLPAASLFNGGNRSYPLVNYTFDEIFVGVFRAGAVQIARLRITATMNP